MTCCGGLSEDVGRWLAFGRHHEDGPHSSTSESEDSWKKDTLLPLTIRVAERQSTSMSGGDPSPDDLLKSSPDMRSFQESAVWQNPTLPDHLPSSAYDHFSRSYRNPRALTSNPFRFLMALGASGIRSTSSSVPLTASSYFCSSVKFRISSHFRPPLHSTQTLVVSRIRKSGSHPPMGCLGFSHLHPYLLKRAEQMASCSVSNSLFLKRTLATVLLSSPSAGCGRSCRVDPPFGRGTALPA